MFVDSKIQINECGLLLTLPDYTGTDRFPLLLIQSPNYFLLMDHFVNTLTIIVHISFSFFHCVNTRRQCWNRRVPSRTFFSAIDSVLTNHVDGAANGSVPCSDGSRPSCICACDWPKVDVTS